MKIRPLSLGIFAGLQLAASAAASATTYESAPPDPSHINVRDVVTTARLAANYLQSNLLSERLKAIDVLAECDAAMHPICRVDLGLAYGQLAQDTGIEDNQRAEYGRAAIARLGHAANLGNVQARKAIAAIADSRPIPSRHPAAVQKEANTVTWLKTAADQQAPVALAKGFGFTAQPVSRFLPMEPHQQAAEPHRSQELERAQEDLQATRMQLEEANRTIASLRSLLASQQQPSFDAAAANRKALAAALNGDYETAIPLFRKAAEANHPGAINNLAMMFVNGTGIARDLQQALTLFERAAHLGNMESAENAARIYNYGIGRPKDPSRARSWYRRAMDLGSPQANRELAEMERAISAGNHF